MSSNLKVNTILPSTGTTIGIGTVGGLINVVGNIDVNSTSGISTFNDLEIADKIIHTGDTNTTIRFPAADTITAETGGSERLRIDSSGRVLIGTTTAGTGSGDDLTISNSSNMGLTLRSTSSNYCNIYFSDATSGTATYEGYISYNHATDSLEFATVHTERLRITSGGELLVGTQNKINTSPTKFQIASNDATGSAILARFNANSYSSYLDFYKSRSNTLGTAYVVNSNDHLGALRFYAADGSNSGYTTAAEIYGSCDGGSGASGDMPGRITFHTRPDGAGQSMQERLRITSDGKVVAGGSGAGYPSRLQSHGAGNLLDLNSTSGAAVIRFYESGSGRFDLRTNNGSSGLNFYDSLNGVERIRITSTGELGVNTTAPVEKLGISGNMRFVNPTGTTSRITALPSGSYNTGTSGGSAICFQRFADGGGGSDEIFFETHWQGNRHGESMRINKHGHVIKSNHPCFDANITSGPVSSTNALVYNNTTVNNGNHYSTSNGRFTAPVTGMYQCWFGAIKQDTTSVARLHMRKNGASANNVANGRQLRLDSHDSNGRYGENGAVTLITNLTQNDYVQVVVTAGTVYGSGADYTYFCGTLVG